MKKSQLEGKRSTFVQDTGQRHEACLRNDDPDVARYLQPRIAPPLLQHRRDRHKSVMAAITDIVFEGGIIGVIIGCSKVCLFEQNECYMVARRGGLWVEMVVKIIFRRVSCCSLHTPNPNFILQI